MLDSGIRKRLFRVCGESERVYEFACACALIDSQDDSDVSVNIFVWKKCVQMFR
jgi:hypothetical protein